MKTYDFTALFFFNGNKKVICLQTESMDGVGRLAGVGRRVLPGDFQIDGKGRNRSKSQPVFLEGEGGEGWFRNGGGLHASVSPVPCKNIGETFPETPQPWPGILPTPLALLRRPAHSQLAHGAGPVPSPALVRLEGHLGPTLGGTCLHQCRSLRFRKSGTRWKVLAVPSPLGMLSWSKFPTSQLSRHFCVGFFHGLRICF